MIHRAAHTEVEARLARIEAALVGTVGLLRCLEVEGVPEQWHSQIEEKRELCQRAALDAIALQQVVLS